MRDHSIEQHMGYDGGIYGADALHSHSASPSSPVPFFWQLLTGFRRWIVQRRFLTLRILPGSFIALLAGPLFALPCPALSYLSAVIQPAPTWPS